MARPWYSRPVVWFGVLVAAVVLPTFTGVQVVKDVAMTIAFVAVVTATIVQAHRFGSRGVLTAAWVCGLGTIAGQIYLINLPPYHNGIDDMGLIMLAWIGLVVAAWSSHPPPVDARSAGTTAS